MAISIDSRTLLPGDTFIPVKGERFDGHDFIPEAIKKGARIQDIDLFEHAKKYRKKLDCVVIGITGSAGKTTVKDMLYAILKQKYRVCCTKQNQNNEFGVALTLLNTDFQTEIIIVEMAMKKAKDIAYLTRMVRPTHTIITGIGHAHIAYFNSLADIAKAKAEIFLSPLTWENKQRFSWINSGTSNYQYLTKRARQKGYQVLPYGGRTFPEQNMSVCYEIAKHFGLTSEDIQKGVEAYIPSEHRLKISTFKEITVIDDTYNANPEGVRFALQYISPYRQRKILVLGDMLELGPYSRKAHKDVITDAINSNVAMIYTYGTLSKEMYSLDIPVYSYTKKAQLHEALFKQLKKGDVVLVKGSRAMKMEETVTVLEAHYA